MALFHPCLKSPVDVLCVSSWENVTVSSHITRRMDAVCVLPIGTPEGATVPVCVCVCRLDAVNQRTGEVNAVTWLLVAVGEFSPLWRRGQPCGWTVSPTLMLVLCLKGGRFNFCFLTLLRDSPACFRLDCPRVSRRSHGRPRRGFVRPAKRG